MKSVNGVPQFNCNSNSANLLKWANEKLRRWHDERSCKNCLYDSDPEVGCAVLNASFRGDDFFNTKLNPKRDPNFYCAAFKTKESGDKGRE